MPNKPVLGRFYFKLTEAGNLIGEYSHSACEQILTESAYRVNDIVAQRSEFVGEYMSSWYEMGGQGCVAAKLSIRHKNPNSLGLYVLEWSKHGTKDLMFEGEAMFCEGLLIGDYRTGHTHLIEDDLSK